MIICNPNYGYEELLGVKIVVFHRFQRQLFGADPLIILNRNSSMGGPKQAAAKSGFSAYSQN